MMPSDRDLMRAAGDPIALQVAWCRVRPEAKLLERDEARRSVKQTLVDLVNRKIQIVEDGERIQADVIVLTRDEFAQCLRKLWAAAALHGSVLVTGMGFDNGVATTLVGRQDPDGTLHILDEQTRPVREECTCGPMFAAEVCADCPEARP